MSEQAKILLDQIRKRRGGKTVGFYAGFPLNSPVSLGASSPLDEMLELYIAARESEDAAKLRARIEKLQGELAETKERSCGYLKKLREAERDRDDSRMRRRAEQKVLYQLLREGDVICVAQEYYGKYENKQRRKITEIDRETGVVTYANWDTRRKDWAKTTHTENIELFALGDSRSVLQVERPDDKETTKARKKKKATKRK